MPRAAGWSVLAEAALEIAALALASRVMGPETAPTSAAFAAVPADEKPRADSEPEIVPESEPDDPHGRRYRAFDDSGELAASFYPDGRVRLTDGARRFAGIVENGRAEMVEIGSGTSWSELLVQTTPAGQLQLELHGGPYDARVFTCEALR